jgi:hypothetical protein
MFFARADRGPAGRPAGLFRANLHRRHLTELRRGMVAAKLATMKMGRPTETTPIDAVSKQSACEILNVGVSTLDRARKIQRIGSPELVAHHGTRGRIGHTLGTPSRA